MILYENIALSTPHLVYQAVVWNNIQIGTSTYPYHSPKGQITWSALWFFFFLRVIWRVAFHHTWICQLSYHRLNCVWGLKAIYSAHVALNFCVQQLTYWGLILCWVWNIKLLPYVQIVYMIKTNMLSVHVINLKILQCGKWNLYINVDFYGGGGVI